MTDEQAPSAPLAIAQRILDLREINDGDARDELWDLFSKHGIDICRALLSPHTQEGGESVGGRDEDNSSPAVAAPGTSTAEAPPATQPDIVERLNERAAFETKWTPQARDLLREAARYIKHLRISRP